MRQYRQGDVLITSTNKKARWLSNVPRENGKLILAYGEATGHAHAILDENAELQRVTSDRSILTVMERPVTLSHEEHGSIQIEPGTYEVQMQRTLGPKEEDILRRAVD